MEIVKRTNVQFGTGFSGPIEITIDAFEDGSIMLAIKSSNSSVYSTVALGPAQTARELAAALTAAADAVDQPKQAE
jgi:hypothetical protein